VSSVIGSDVITFYPDRISFGIKPDAAEAGMTVDIKVSRDKFSSLTIAKQVKLVVPTLYEGWIPCAAFRAQIKKQGGEALFLQYDMFDIEAAKTWLTNNEDPGPSGFYTDVPIADITGIEFLKAIRKLRGWNNSLLQVYDLSNTNIETLHCDHNGKLKTIILGPKSNYMNFRACAQLKTLDLRKSPLMYFLLGIEGSDVTVLDTLDLRKPSSLWPTATKPVKWDGAIGYVMSQGGVVKISEYYYNNHDSNDATTGWNCLVNQFKTNGIKVEVWNDAGDTKLYDGTDENGAHPIIAQ
jgi:hypothetical protein